MSLRRPPVFDPLRFVSFVGRRKTRHEAIAEIAYFRAMKRGFAPGHELEDWSAAEAEFQKEQQSGLGRETPSRERPILEETGNARPGEQVADDEVATTR